MSTLLDVDGITVTYGTATAVREVSLRVDAGEIVTVLGLNGAGKTSLLSAIVGLVPIRSGSITFDGRTISGLSLHAIARSGISLVPEGRRIFSRLTVEENLRTAAGAAPKSVDTRAAMERVLHTYPKLRELASRPAGLLSGGEQQQLAIGRALLSQPRLLILDEPSLGLAPTMIDIVFRTLVDLRDSGSTILIVEQNVRRTLELADRAYVMARGRIALSGTAAEVAGGEDVSSHYFGDA